MVPAQKSCYLGPVNGIRSTLSNRWRLVINTCWRDYRFPWNIIVGKDNKLTRDMLNFVLITGDLC